MDIINNQDIARLKERAEEGEEAAQFELGSHYTKSKDYKKAVKWFTKAAKHNNINSQIILGYFYYKGEGVDQNFNKAFEWYKKAADQNNALAQRALGGCYLNGNGVEQSFEKAFEWYKKAADQNNAVAQCMLGVCYYYGNGVEQSFEQAFEWFSKAANQNNAVAQCMSGVCYYRGRGIEQNSELAFEWFSKAAIQGDVIAQIVLGYCCYYGVGGKKHNSKKADEYFTKANKRNTAITQLMLGEKYYIGKGVEYKIDQAIECFDKESEHGDGIPFYFMKDQYFNKNNSEQVENFLEKKEQVLNHIKPKKPLNIASFEDLNKFVEKCCKNITTIEKSEPLFYNELYIINIKINGDKYNSTITSSVMEYILNIQKWIYKTYKYINNGKLSEADKKKLEIVVYIEKGSSEIIFSLFKQLDIISRAVDRMSGSQLTAVAITAIIILGAVAITKYILKYKGKKLRKDAEIQHAKYLVESHSKNLDEINKYNQKTLQTMLHIFETIEVSRKEAISSLKVIKEDNKITMNDSDIVPSSLTTEDIDEEI